MNSMENLCSLLESIGISDEYVGFIVKNISDDMTADSIANEIEKKRICDTESFIEFLIRNFKMFPDMKPDIDLNSGIELSRKLIASGLNAYSKVLNTAVDKLIDIAENGSISELEKQISEEQENIISVKAEEFSDSIPAEENTEPEKKVPLSNSEITHHTASMWKYQPVNDSEPENSTEYKTKYLKMPCAEIIGASVRGKKHKHDGSNRDDWFDFEKVDDIAVMAVSDGAGSKKFSRIGARISCTESVKCAVKLIKKMKSEGKYNECLSNISASLNSAEFIKGCTSFADIIQESVISAYEAVQKAFDERRTKYLYLDVLKRDMSVKDFSSTLLMAIALPVIIDGEKQLFVISCQIGDGVITAVNRKISYDEAVRLLGEADSGTFAGETDFITSENMKRKETLMGRTIIARREISDVLIMTDGVSDDYYPNSSQIGRLFMDLQLNGIIEIPDIVCTDEELKKLIPEPSSYPWVNDNNIQVSVNYASAIEKSCSFENKDLWQNYEIMGEALDKLEKNNIPPEEKLKIWLDNYVERGSFDDRTLLIYSVREVAENEKNC